MKKLVSILTALTMTAGLLMPVSSAMTCGDLDNSGKCNVNDIVILLRYIGGSMQFTAEEFNAANTYTYGETFATVNAQDLAVLVQYVLGDITAIPISSAPVTTTKATTTTTKATTTTTKATTTTTVTTAAPANVSNPMEYFNLGDKVSDVSSKLGMPYRTIADGDTYWKFYGSYSKFFLVWEVQGKVELMYGNYGISASSSKYTVLKDGNDGNKVYAAIKSNQVSGSFTKVTNTINAFEQIVFELTNSFRAFSGKSTLVWQSGLAKAAQLHAEDMAKNNYFDHVGLNGSTFSSRAKAQGVTADAENIIAGYLNPFYALDGWINSAGHRTNILATHSALGVGWGYYENSTYKYYGVQLFK